MSEPKLGGKWELLDDERGRTWTVKTEFTVTAPNGKKLTIPVGFTHDRASFAPDCNDNTAFISHDRAYAVRRWDDGSSMKRKDADDMMRKLMEDSEDEQARGRAAQYHKFVRAFGWWSWHKSRFADWVTGA